MHGKATCRFIGLIAGLFGIAMAVAPPAGWFALSLESLRVQLDKEAEIDARTVSGFVAANPVLWRYDEIRLHHVLESRGTLGVPERRRILDAQGEVASAGNGALPSPILSGSSPIWDAGVPVGRIVVDCSLRPLVRRATIIGLFSTAFSGGALLLFLFYPVSGLRRALDSLSVEKERAQVTLDSITDGVIRTGKDGKVLLMNRAAEAITGWSRADAAGKFLCGVFPVRAVGGRPISEIPLPSGSGEILDTSRGVNRLVDFSWAPILARGEAAAGSVVVFRDVTEKTRMEEEVLRGRKVESLGLLAGGIAHDFNNLLTGVVGNISLAKEMIPSDQRAYLRLEEAESASMKAKDLAARLLAFSKGGKSDRREIPVEAVIRDAAILSIRGTNVRLELLARDGLWAVFADAGQIGQVISNLVVNAVHAMPRGGTVRVTLENASIGKGEVPHVKEGKYVRVAVTDEGTGIPESVLPQVFDPYFTTKAKGNGLGLATCYTIMKSHGGNIFAESVAGRGATFRLYIPSTGNAARAAEQSKSRDVLPGKGRVLFMDDEDALRDVAGKMLTHLGYEPRFARNGEEALAMYSKEAGGPGAFDLVILDLTVPGGMGGKETAGSILKDHPDARILISSGHVNAPEMSDPGEHGFVGVVAKPYKLEELGRALFEARKPK